LAENLQEFEKLWDWTAKQWQEELSEVERKQLALLGTEVERDLFRILRSFAIHANPRVQWIFLFQFNMSEIVWEYRFDMSASCGGISLIPVSSCKLNLRERIVARLGSAGH